MRRGPSIRWLLLGANALMLLVPLMAIVGLRLYDVALLRQTERQLIAESVLIGESFREAYVRLGGRRAEFHQPPQQRRDRYAPIEPVIDVGTPLLSQTIGARAGASKQPLAQQAGHAIEPLMRRAQTFNLSGVRVLDAIGCVVATTGAQRDECLERAPEVKAALAGRYFAVTRERISDEPKPAFGDLRRRGGVRVFVALPVWHDDEVIAVVTASRTGLDAWSSLWQNRREIVIVSLSTLALMVFAALFFAWTLARPLRRLTESARTIVAGGPVPKLSATGFLPSEIAVLSDALHEMTQRLQGRAEEAAERTARVSHELKTPLSAIRGAVELLRDSHDMPEAQRDRFIANIDADAERMERLVTRLLTLARIESDATKATDPIDVEAAVRSWLARYDDVRIEVSDTISPLSIREDHLASVVNNLVDNARRHGAGKPVVVRLTRERGDGVEHVRIDVIDQGTGISEANQTRVFDRFFTTERDRGGTGLGLSIVKAVADARGGSVTFETSDRGTRFTVLL